MFIWLSSRGSPPLRSRAAFPCPLSLIRLYPIGRRMLLGCPALHLRAMCPSPTRYFGALYAPASPVEITSFEVPEVAAITSGGGLTCRRVCPFIGPIGTPVWDRHVGRAPRRFEHERDGTSTTVYGALTCRGGNIWRRVLQDRDRGSRQGLRQRRSRGGRVRGGGARSTHVCHG